MDKAMEAAWLAGGVALHEHAPDLGMITRTAIVHVVCEAAIPAYVRATPDPVAPTPSPAPDIAGLVEKAAVDVEYLGRDFLGSTANRIGARIDELATAQERDAGTRLAAEALINVEQNYAILQARAEAAEADTARWIARVSEIREASALGGGPMLTELAEAIRARLSSARDEGLEMAAKVADELRNAATPGEHKLFGQGMANAADQISAAIRALKGTKPLSENTGSIAKPMNCTHCGRIHEGQRCPAVKAIEYYPDGKVKRVEYHMQDLGGLRVKEGT